MAHLIVYNSNNGHSIKVPKPVRFHKLPDFKNFILDQFGISEDNIFLLTSFGIKLNFNLLNELNDVFVYDKRIFSNDYLIQEEVISAPPTVAAPSSPKSAWSRKILQECVSVDEKTKQLVKQINIEFKALNLIFQFCTNFVNEIEKTFGNYLNYIKLINYKSLTKLWSQNLEALKKFPVIKIGTLSITLSEYLNTEQLETAANYVSQNLPMVVEKFNLMNESFSNINNEKNGVDKSIEILRNESISNFKNLSGNTLLVDIQKIVSTNPESTVDLQTNAQELFNYLFQLKKFQARLQKSLVAIFNSVANLQMKVVTIKADLKLLTAPDSNSESKPDFETINKIKQYEDHLSLTIDLPLLFGFMLIEKRRQTEWYDFYSKGIVNNVSEQLSTIIDNERLFRKIWLKKFGNFLSLLGDDTPVITLPNIDISLIGKNTDTFNILQKLTIQREDVINYISLLDTTTHSKNFVQLLNKNFKDLTKSTDNLRKITKLVSSLSTFTSNSELKSYAEEEFDLNLIRDLKLRIKKLENLLHQQQYKNLNTWPVVNSLHNADGGMSMIMQKQLEGPAKGAQRNGNGSMPPPVVSPRTNPTLLLQKKPSNRNSDSQVLDSSVIDKHLDNIRLRKEIAEVVAENRRLEELNKLLVLENNQLRNRNDSLSLDNRAQLALIADVKYEVTGLNNQKESDRKEYEMLLNQANANHESALRLALSNRDQEQVSQLEKQLQEKSKELQAKEDELQAKDNEFHTLKINTSKASRDVENLTYKVNQRDNQITELQGHIAKFTELNTNSSQEIFSLNGTVKTLRDDLNDVVKMKNDLLSNMSLKELEFSSERKSLEGEIKQLQTKVEQLQTKIEEVTEDYENLMELTQNTENVSAVQELNSIIAHLLQNISKLVEHNFDYFLEFCFVLESMGLLLVKEDNEYKISRVKGLRSKKEDEIILEKPTSKVIDQVEQSKKWADDLKVVDEDDSTTLIAVYNKNFKNGAFDLFLNTVSFNESTHDGVTSKFFLNAISKRFRDVEGFAKRQTKDNKTKQQDIQRLTNRVNSKISMNGFQEDDLVLFLPTRIDRENDVSESFQPWAAFNIGAPHYFLDREQEVLNKDWMVGRVRKITERLVTAENVEDTELNPFQLSVGVVWFMVDAESQL